MKARDALSYSNVIRHTNGSVVVASACGKNVLISPEGEHRVVGDDNMMSDNWSPHGICLVQPCSLNAGDFVIVEIRGGMYCGVVTGDMKLRVMGECTCYYAIGDPIIDTLYRVTGVPGPLSKSQKIKKLLSRDGLNVSENTIDAILKVLS